MAAPKLVAVIGVRVAAANTGEFVLIRNLTRGGKLTGAVEGVQKSIVFNKAPAIEWQDGDLIQGEIRGRLKGVKQETIKSGGIRQIVIVGTADTATAGVAL